MNKGNLNPEVEDAIISLPYDRSSCFIVRVYWTVDSKIDITLEAFVCRMRRETCIIQQTIPRLSRGLCLTSTNVLHIDMSS